MKVTTRSTIYFVILVLLCLISVWYFYCSQEPLENLDEMLESGNSCDGPFGCKTPAEIKKEGAAELKRTQDELQKPYAAEPNIVDNDLQITLTNLSPYAQEQKYNLPSKPKKLNLGMGMGMNGGMNGGMNAILLNYYTKFLIKEKVLSNTKSDVYMLDVDPKDVGPLNEASYTITTMLMNYHTDAEPSKLPTYTFNEYIPRNKSLHEIYKKKTQFINDVVTIVPKITVSKDTKYSEYSDPRNSNIKVKLDKAKPNNNFIIIKPDTNDTFPNKFQFEITNNTVKNNQLLYLWGDYFLNKNKPQPDGKPNKILDIETLSKYTGEVSKTVFGYNKDAFGESCYELADEVCKIGDVDVGKRCINIIQSGDVYDETNDKIGSVSITDATETDPFQKIVINIEKDNVTGMLLYVSYLV